MGHAIKPISLMQADQYRGFGRVGFRPPGRGPGRLAPGSGSRKNSAIGTSRQAASLSRKSKVALPRLFSSSLM